MFQDYEVIERQRETPHPDMKDFLIDLPGIGKVAQANLSRNDIDAADARHPLVAKCLGSSAAEGVWYDFTRLFVPPENRGARVGSALMRSVCAWADNNDVGIYNCVGPGYVALEEVPRVIAFFERFGFVHHGEGELTRVPE